MANERFRWNPSPRAIGLMWALGLSLAAWALILWLLSTGWALSQPAISLLEPPAVYDHEPRQAYTVTVINDRMELVKRCRMGFHAHLLGCARVKQNDIYIIGGLSEEDFDLVLAHEKAHLNGWRH